MQSKSPALGGHLGAMSTKLSPSTWLLLLSLHAEELQQRLQLFHSLFHTHSGICFFFLGLTSLWAAGVIAVWCVLMLKKPLILTLSSLKLKVQVQWLQCKKDKKASGPRCLTVPCHAGTEICDIAKPGPCQIGNQKENLNHWSPQMPLPTCGVAQRCTDPLPSLHPRTPETKISNRSQMSTCQCFVSWQNTSVIHSGTMITQQRGVLCNTFVNTWPRWLCWSIATLWA